MAKSNPYQAAQAALVLNHLVLDVGEINAEALTRFCNDPQSEERTKVTELFTAKAKKVSILEYLFTRWHPAIKEFVVCNKFVVDTSDTAELKISCLGTNFENWFLGKVEKDVGACEVKVSKLLRRSLDKPILDELGGTAEKALAHVYEFLKSADHNSWYIFYVKDVSDVLRAVSARWSGDGWHVGARSVEYPIEWLDGFQVVSR